MFEEEENNNTVSIQDILSTCNQELLLVSKLSSSTSIKTCTYSKGYISQEVYACLTCYNETKKFGVICLGCSFKCHKQHELIHLYFKRNVRCDCGNSHFISECVINKNKDYENYENEYNHNYIGKYCSCDEEDKGSEMIQCFICEDWFHIEHLNIMYGDDTINQGELICKECFKNKMSFILNGYYDIESIIVKDYSPPEMLLSEDNDVLLREDVECKRNYKIKKTNDIISEIVNLKKDVIVYGEKLEELLCKCNKCLLLYKDKNVSFLGGNAYKEWNERNLFEDEINSEIDIDKEENKMIIDNINEINLYQTNVIKNLNYDKQIELSLITKEFKEQFTQYINELLLKEKENGKEIIITYEHIQDFLRKFKSVLHK